MLRRLTVRDFKSLHDVTVDLPRLSVLFGPNAAGKSNFLEAIQALSWIGNANTLFDALGPPLPVRGHPFEAFSLAPAGFAGRLDDGSADLTLEADLATDHGKYRYRIQPRIHYRSGQLSVADEYLALLSASNNPKFRPAIERVEKQIHVRRKGKPAHPRQEPVGLNHSVLSDRSLSGIGYAWLDHVRHELANWRVYYFEPRMGMRQEQAPAAVTDIGIHGEYIASFLYSLQGRFPKYFEAVSRSVRTIIPSVEDLRVELDQNRGTLNLLVRQAGVEYSSRIMSEGTLRVLALCSIAVNPWSGSLLALEEPENGVDPRQIDLIALLLLNLAESRQVIVTTHSPIFVDAILKARNQAKKPQNIGLFNCRLGEAGTRIAAFEVSGPLFKDQQVRKALTSAGDDAVFQHLLLRGLLND
ncbi:MAG: AAA family ATPase [Acidobacteria bacterium]|nr:AAA family ATPase [Acidobacteriota bacterium]MYE42934.1 AAA family ATPase [Acidobacteriota bacterium]